MTPTPRTAALIAGLALASIAVPLPIVLLAAAALAGAFAVDARSARRPPLVERQAPVALVRGVAAPLQLAVGERAGATVVRQPSAAGLTVDPPEAQGRLEASLTGRRRGRYELPPPATRTEGPLGLASAYASEGETAELRVYPDVPGARRLAFAIRQGRFRETAGRGPGPLGLGTDFESIRPYVPGDDVRQINWKATGRAGRPMSNQYREEQEREIVCLLDCGRLMAAPIQAGSEATRLDAALDAVVAVGLVADELGDRFGACAFDRELRGQLRPRRNGGAAVVRAFFDIQPRAVESDYELAFRVAGAGKRAQLIVLTDLLDEAAASSLVAAVPVVARRHAVLVASASDPDLLEIVRREPRSALDLHAAIAARDVLRRRDEAAARVRRSGAQVVEAPPALLARACVTGYLRSKARALL